MLVAIIAAFVSICAIVIIHHYAVKTRLTEGAIDEAIERRLGYSPVMRELRDLRELNGVMRNLLIDVIEAEDIKPQGVAGQVTAQERRRLVSIREDRRREIYAEALVLVRQTKAPVNKTRVQ